MRRRPDRFEPRCAASGFAPAALRRSRPLASRAVRPGWSANGYDVQLRRGVLMSTRAPRVDFDGRYSDPEASATDWQSARQVLAATELSWLTTVRPDGRPHSTPLITVWHDEAVHFCTGPEERK